MAAPSRTSTACCKDSLVLRSLGRDESIIRRAFKQMSNAPFWLLHDVVSMRFYSRVHLFLDKRERTRLCRVKLKEDRGRASIEIANLNAPAVRTASW